MSNTTNARFAYWVNGTVVFSDSHVYYACEDDEHKVLCADSGFNPTEQGYYGYWKNYVGHDGNARGQWIVLNVKDMPTEFKIQLLLLGVPI